MAVITPPLSAEDQIKLESTDVGENDEMVLRGSSLVLGTTGYTDLPPIPRGGGGYYGILEHYREVEPEGYTTAGREVYIEVVPSANGAEYRQVWGDTLRLYGSSEHTFQGIVGGGYDAGVGDDYGTGGEWALLTGFTASAGISWGTQVVDAAYGIRANTYNYGSTTIPLSIGVEVRTPSGTGAITDQYGIKVADQERAGVTNAYAIHTGTGPVSIGDDLVIRNNADGVVLADRSDGHTYRLKVDGGVLGVEQLSEPVAASGYFEFLGLPSADDPMPALNGFSTIVFRDAGSPTWPDVPIVGGNLSDTLNTLKDSLNDHRGDGLPNGWTYTFDGVDKLVITADTPGAAGNSYTLGESTANIIRSGATLTGGVG